MRGYKCINKTAREILLTLGFSHANRGYALDRTSGLGVNKPVRLHAITHTADDKTEYIDVHEDYAVNGKHVSSRGFRAERIRQLLFEVDHDLPLSVGHKLKTHYKGLGDAFRVYSPDCTNVEIYSTINTLQNNEANNISNMAREATFNFVAESTIKSRKEQKKENAWATVNGKYNTIRFSPEYIQEKGLNGMFIKLYYDKAKKTIAWRKMENVDSLKALAGHRQVQIKKYKTGKYDTTVCQLSITTILKELGVGDKTFTRAQIKTYHTGGLLGESYDYVTLN